MQALSLPLGCSLLMLGPHLEIFRFNWSGRGTGISVVVKASKVIL